MISGQIDRLRTAAQTYRRLGNHSAESMLLDAADTIWQLRDDLQRANDAVRDAEHEESRAWDRVRKAEAEVDRLRELVRDMMRAWWACDNEVCPRHDERCEKGKYCAFDECAQELGIEVD